MLVACALLIAPISAIAQSKTLVWQRLDSDITVQPNGDLRIIETNVIRFTSGSFTFGYRDIKQDRLTEISDIEVTEGVENGVPLRFETTQTDTGDFRIMHRKVADILKKMPEQHKFLRGQIAWVGFNQTFIVINLFNYSTSNLSFLLIQFRCLRTISRKS